MTFFRIANHITPSRPETSSFLCRRKWFPNAAPNAQAEGVRAAQTEIRRWRRLYDSNDKHGTGAGHQNCGWMEEEAVALGIAGSRIRDWQ